MTKQRKQYSKEFKLEMVKPIEEQNQRVVDIAKQICFNGAPCAPYTLRGGSPQKSSSLRQCGQRSEQLNGLTTCCSGQPAARPAAEPER